MQFWKDTGYSTRKKTDSAVLSGPLLTQCEDAVKAKIKVPKQQRPIRKFSSSSKRKVMHRMYPDEDRYSLVCISD